MSPTPTEITVQELVERWDVFLLDAFGVLVDSSQALPGAVELVARLLGAGKELFVVSNDASRSVSTLAARFDRFGFEIAADRILTSGSLIAPYFEQHDLAGASVLVLGPEDSVEYVRAAGGVPTAACYDCDYDVIAACDDAGYPFLESVDIALTSIFRQVDRGDRPHLLLPNPDLIYPKAPGAYGFTAGAVAHLLEAALRRRYGIGAPEFARLGKPFPPLFEEARRRAAPGRMVMVGDQLETDIAGARGAGIDAVLLGTGVSRWQDDAVKKSADHMPTHILGSL